MELVAQRHLFHLRLARYFGEIQVLSLRGIEATNALFRFRIRVAVPAGDAEAFSSAATEASATVSLVSGDVTRFVHGIVGAVTTRDVMTGDHAVFDLRVVPRLERLRYIKRNRIFQDKTTPEILAQVLNERGIRHRWRLQRAYEKRAYTTQYAESELAFVQRLCAEEGIFTFFDHPREAGPDDVTSLGDAEIFVFADTAEGTSPIDGAPELRHRAHDATGGMLQEEEHVHDFSMRHALRTKAVFLRSFSHESPMLEHRDLASAQALGAAPRGPSDPGRTQLAQGVTTYDHLGAREQTRTMPEAATIAFEQARHGAVRGGGQSACRRLMPGRTFRLVDHDASALNGDYAIARVEHIGRAPQTGGAGPVYENRFEVVPRTIAMRPTRSTHGQRATHETAIVVGPPGQDVHTDELGRVKVQFHWDLEGRNDEKSSCWLRVTQAWAGAGYGTQFVPRVGTEVMVSFLGGDPDRPVVTGCLYNGINPPPFTLPEDAERSGIRTRSMPDGGFNELVFGDARGREFVTLKSEGSLSLSAGQGSTLVAAGSHELVVGGEARASIARSQRQTVGADNEMTISGEQRVRIAANATHAVGGNERRTVARFRSEEVGEGVSEIIGGFRNVVIGRVDAGEGSDSLTVGGSRVVTTRGEHRLVSGQALAFSCGDSELVLYPDRIVLTSPAIELRARDRVLAAQGAEPAVQAQLSLAGAASLSGGSVTASAGEGASLVLDAEAKLDGALVKLNCGASSAGATLSSTAGADGRAQIVVLSEGLPVGTSEVTLVLVAPTGETEERVVGVDVPIDLSGPVGATYTVFALRVGDAVVPFIQRAGGDDAESL